MVGLAGPEPGLGTVPEGVVPGTGKVPLGPKTMPLKLQAASPAVLLVSKPTILVLAMKVREAVVVELTRCERLHSERWDTSKTAILLESVMQRATLERGSLVIAIAWKATAVGGAANDDVGVKRVTSAVRGIWFSTGESAIRVAGRHQPSTSITAN